MKVVYCDVEPISLPGDYTTREGDHVQIPSVRATCRECGHETESFGQHERSVRRCLVLMREECPNRGCFNLYRNAENAPQPKAQAAEAKAESETEAEAYPYWEDEEPPELPCLGPAPDYEVQNQKSLEAAVAVDQEVAKLLHQTS